MNKYAFFLLNKLAKPLICVSILNSAIVTLKDLNEDDVEFDESMQMDLSKM